MHIHVFKLHFNAHCKIQHQITFLKINLKTSKKNKIIKFEKTSKNSHENLPCV